MTEPQQQMLSTVDPRFSIEGRPIFESKKSLMTVRCAACGTALAYTNIEERGVKLARSNATTRPCCDAW